MVSGRFESRTKGGGPAVKVVASHGMQRSPATLYALIAHDEVSDESYQRRPEGKGQNSRGDLVGYEFGTTRLIGRTNFRLIGLFFRRTPYRMYWSTKITRPSFTSVPTPVLPSPTL